jgi:hypothetical protein
MCRQQNNCATGFLQGGIGDCGKDIECICKNETFLGEIACCLVDACSAEDQKKAVAAAANVSPFHTCANPNKQTDRERN